MYLNSTEKLLGFLGGFNVYSEKSIRVVCVAFDIQADEMPLSP
jgi:hypothetical protein